MKLRAFNIKNYRSIIDSGWNYLAYDNITALIGQNESGKTSVLEALRSFYEARISDDVLRSDMTFPYVACIFDLENSTLIDFLDIRKIPESLATLLKTKKDVVLLREWKEDRSSIIKIADHEIVEYFENLRKAKEDLEKRVRDEISELLQKADRIVKEMESSENEKNEARDQLNEWYIKLETAKKKVKKARKPDVKLISEQELESAKQVYQQKEELFNTQVKKFEEKKLQTQEISEKVTICRKCNEAIEVIRRAEYELKQVALHLREAEHLFDICSNDREKRSAIQRLELAKAEYNRINAEFEQASENESLLKSVAAKVFDGYSYRIAESEAIAELEYEKKQLTAEDIGEIIAEHIPEFEFFEDFSSLLPNKIDLEDLLTENANAEGYKAAKNFLLIAGLNSDFFREKNHRILKQKIENLNGEITINFQDYWRQNVGKNNKITLNFELEHYDYTVPEKSGKPYLEFWIKDKSERLYPKQRSRGVRWFLSFYLELKASAKQNSINRILLIDEPGLSLHARAQEDVLAVFEDLKNKMQILYSTHSPHLVDINKIYRLLAVQRANVEDEYSETVILDAKSLHNASSDTLSPIYSLMGARLNEQQLIKNKNNIIVQDTVTFYYLNAITALFAFTKEVNFIPSSGLTGINSLSNLLTGWKIDFSVLLIGNGENKQFADELKRILFIGKEKDAEQKIKVIDSYIMIEDVFSTIDFKRFILQKRIGITESNSEHIQANALSRTLLASSFLTCLKDNHTKSSDFDEETHKNVKKLFSALEKMV